MNPLPSPCLSRGREGGCRCLVQSPWCWGPCAAPCSAPAPRQLEALPGKVQRSITALKSSHGQDSWASWGNGGSGCPSNGATRAAIPVTYITTGLSLAHTSWSCFSRGFGVISSHSYSTRCHMAASELFGCLIGGVDVKAKWGERKYQKPPWGHPAKPGGDSRAHCELSRHVFVPATRGMNKMRFRSARVFPPSPLRLYSCPRCWYWRKVHPEKLPGILPGGTGTSGTLEPGPQAHTVPARHRDWNQSFDFCLCPLSGLVLNVWFIRCLMSLWV